MNEMYNNQIEVTANRSDDEAWRLTRLERVIGYIAALADHYGNEKLLSKIKRLHDHKGTLTVTWNIDPSSEEKDFCLKAWKSIIGDGADNVEHETN